jgi:hypothetical protein
MSVTRPIRVEWEGDPFGLSAAGQLCFFCGQFVQDPAVMWSGSNSQIYLHAACVIDWFPRMLRDALELRYRNHPVSGVMQ